MRAPALLALSGLVLGAAACATTEPPAEVAAASPSPLPVEGYDWLLTLHDDMAHLAYGAPESDDLQLGFNCRQGSGRVGMVTIAGTGRNRSSSWSPAARPNGTRPRPSRRRCMTP